MKRTLKFISILLLLALSEILKIQCVMSVMHPSYYYEVFDVEKMNYLLNAIIIFVMFYALIGRLATLVGKLTAAFGATLLFATQLIAENGFLLYLQSNMRFNWEDPFSYGDMILYGIERYFEYWVPQYHIVLPVFLLAMVAAALYRHYKPNILKKL